MNNLVGKTALRFVWGLLTWVGYNLISVLILQTLGYFLVPLVILLRRKEISYVTGKEIINAPRWLWLWGNDEDGLDPDWYRTATSGWNKYVRMWVWAAWRNPVNNLRFLKPLHPPPVIGKVKYESYKVRGYTIWFIWQGWATRLVIITPSNKWLTVGWKYWIDDATVECTDWRRFGVGFGTRYA